MKRKSKIIISITGIFLVLLILSGLTYAYFLTNIQGNTNTKSVSITSANLQLTYNDGNGTIIGTNIVPGTTLGEKTFSVTNTGNVSVSYGVYIEDVINEFERTSDITLTLTCESNKANTTCDGASTIFPENNRKIVTNDISSGETQTYRLVVEYIEAGVDQSVDMGKRLSGKVQIYGSERLTLEFNIANSRSGDYGIIESEPKTSYANIENGTGTYRFVGVPMGSHTLTIYDENDNIKGSSPITIGTGNSTSVENTNITVPETTEEISIPVNNISVGSMELGTVKLYEKGNPYIQGTLAYQIIHNAMFVTDEEKELKYAEFRKTPMTSPGNSQNKQAYKSIGNEASNNTNITITPAQQEYYWTYATNYTIDKNTGKYSLVNPKKCKYNEDNCIRDLVNRGENIYVFSNNAGNFTNSNNTLKSTTNLASLYRIIISPEVDTENNITLVTHQITNILYSVENILTIADDDYGKSYYYRGDVTNNYINFAGMCWRIVRIEGDESIKLILQDKNTVCNDNVETDIDNDEIFNNGKWDISGRDQFNNYKNFQNSLSQNYFEKLKFGDWCYDDKAFSSSTGGEEIIDKNMYIQNRTNFYYDSYVRLYGKSTKEPTFKCNGTIMNQFKDNETNMYVGGLTADEVVYAGGIGNPWTYSNNKKYYLLYGTNASFILLSLNRYIGSQNYQITFVVGTGNGYISDNGDVRTRPSIVLTPDIEITSGNGSIEHPYKVE